MEIFLLTLVHTAYFFVAPMGGITPPYGKSTLKCLSPIFFYTVTYTYIDSLNPRGQVSIFKTLEMRSAQSSAANLTNASKIRKLKIKSQTISGHVHKRY